ncbi:uncharacterized protein [Nicotiana sylvestris]|uniref:uncharacterized protein n=1 Tax=Nicotiana sylvestris TaxID=4096 RepID=UPI00388C90BB
MPFGLKNAGATYKRAMTTIFHDMIHKEIEVYVDDVIIKSRKQSDHVKHLRKFFQRLRRYNIKLNPTKCAFGVPSGKLLGFIVSRRVIELDPSKIKAIQELPLPRNKTEVISLLGRLNYISRFIAQLTTTCEPILKLLKKDDTVKWTDECQEAFNKIKEYLSNPLVLVPSKPGRPLVLYLTVLDNSFGCVLGQHDITGWKEQAIYYLSKKFTSYEILLTEFDIVYVTRTAMKAQALADYLAGNPVDEEYEPLKTYFPDEEVMHIDEFEKDEKYGWKLFFDGDANMKGFGIGVVLISEIGHHYAVTAQLRFYCTNNMAEYKACILGLRLDVDMGVQEVLALGDSDLSDLCQRFRSVEFRHIPRIYNEVADVLATLALMLHHLDKAYIDPLHIQIHDQHVYCNMVEEELDGEPWFHDIRENIKSGAQAGLFPLAVGTSQAGGGAQTPAARTPKQRLHVDQVPEIIHVQTVVPGQPEDRAVASEDDQRRLERFKKYDPPIFSGLARHAPALVSTVHERVRRLIEGLIPSIKSSMARELEMNISYQQVVSIARRGSWDQFFPLAKLAFNNSYQSSIKMPPYKALYGERVLLRVSPMKGVMRFGKRGNLSPRFLGPFKVLRRVGEVAYELALPPSLEGVHPGANGYIGQASLKADVKEHCISKGSVARYVSMLVRGRMNVLRGRGSNDPTNYFEN